MSVTSVLYFAVAAGTWPTFSRYRYRQRRGRHPQTHERDVYADVLHSIAEGGVCAVLWLPIVVSRYTLRAGWWLARVVLGKSVRMDLTAARTARFEAELAAMDSPNVVPLHHDRPVTLRHGTGELRAKIVEAERIRSEIRTLEAFDGTAERIRELRTALREKMDAVRALADDLSGRVAQ